MSENNGTEGKGTTKRNMLADHQKFAVYSYVITHRDRLEKAKTAEEVVKEVNENAGAKHRVPFVVTIDNLIPIFREVGVELPRPADRTAADLVRLVRHEVREVAARVAVIEAAGVGSLAASVEKIGHDVDAVTDLTEKTAANLSARITSIEADLKAVQTALLAVRPALRKLFNKFPDLKADTSI